MLVYCDDCADSVVSVVCEDGVVPGVLVERADGGVSAVPVGVMPLLTSAMLVRRVDGCASAVPI